MSILQSLQSLGWAVALGHVEPYLLTWPLAYFSLEAPSAIQRNTTVPCVHRSPDHGFGRP